MCTLIKEKLPDYVHADRKDIQILTPTRKSAVGAQRLNRIMQQYLNPPSADKMEKEVGDTIYRVGDKVMQIKNNYQLEWERKSRYGVTYDRGNGIFNGDTGVIEDINFFRNRCWCGLKTTVLYTMILHSWMNWSWHMRLQFTNRRAVNIRQC